MALFSRRDTPSDTPGLGFGIVLALGIGVYVGQRVTMQATTAQRVLTLLLVAGLCVLPWMLRSWRAGFIVVFVYMAFSGFVNHLTNYHPLTRILSFVLVGIISLHWFLGEVMARLHRAQRVEYPLSGLVLLFASLSILEIFNPIWHTATSGVKPGLAGLATHVLPMVLLFVGYDLIDRRSQITSFLVLVICLVTFMAFFGIYQYYVGIEGVSNWGKSFEDVVSRERVWGRNFELEIRPISFAKDAGAAGAFYMFGICCGLLLFMRPDCQPREAAWLLPAMLIMGVSLLQTQIRLNFVAALIAPLPFMVFVNARKGLVIFLVLALAFGAAYVLYEESSRQLLVDRFLVLSDPLEAASEHRGVQAYMILVMSWQYPFGSGIGRAGPGAYYQALPEDISVGITPGENYYANVVYETGVIGLGILVTIFVLILRQGVKIYLFELRDPTLRLYALGSMTLVVAILLMGMGGPALYSAPLNLVFWLVAGVLYKLPKLQASGAATGCETAAHPAVTRALAPAATPGYPGP